jgi:hypothetical protein
MEPHLCRAGSLSWRAGRDGRSAARLQRLSVGLAAHPFWETSAGRSPAARVELRQWVRELEVAEDLLTDQQQRILACIRDWVAEHGEAPTMRDIGRSVGLSSTGSISYQLGRLEQVGVIRGGKGRIALRR